MSGLGRIVPAWIVACAMLAACAGERTGGEAGAVADTAGEAGATPVRTALVTRGTLAVIASGPGRTDALDVQKLRAPFTGTLRTLRVVVGDRVSAGQVVASVVSQASEAALTGAQAMQRAATTDAERSDAARALELAQRNLVETPLTAPRAGVVVSRGASQGDLVSQGDSIVSIASASSIVFVARIAQSDLGRIHPGQRATIEAPGLAAPLPGVVHGTLPADTSSMTVPVRIDLPPGRGPVPIGLFGTVHIVVGEHSGAAIVPALAVMRDDITGTARMAVVTAAARAHWIAVTPGLQQGDSVEITQPALPPGTRVIVSGQVGLPEGNRVSEVRDALPAPAGGSPADATPPPAGP